MDFKFNPTQIAHQTPVEVSLDADPHPFRESPVPKHPRFASEYDEVFAQMTSSPRSELFCLLMLVEPPRWMKGLWGQERDGWNDTRTDTFLSFDAARQLIDDRIRELGLNAELVHAYPHSSLADRGETVADEQAFWRGSFESRMERFRK